MSMTLMIAAALATQKAADSHATHRPPLAEQSASVIADESAVRAVLARYKSAIERLDVTGTKDLFTQDSTVFETGGVEGTYEEYLAHHLAPEMAAFRAFAFSNYRVTVRIEGNVALATETYRYRIETKSGEIATRNGVATSALIRTTGGWKILSMHSSARKPKEG